MTDARSVIVNADDFGASRGVNRGILEAHARGIVTSTSLMVRGPAAGEARTLSREHPRLSVGLHVDIGEWRYSKGRWTRLYQVVPDDDRDALAAEVATQIDAFRALIGAAPTHLDSHQHAHRDEPLAGVVGEAASVLGVPVRERCPAVRYRGDFYGQTARGEPHHEAISPQSLIELLRSLAPGCTEIGCHPGYADDLASSYSAERALEVRALCDPRVRAVLDEEGIELWSFAEVELDG
jgi:chitin disaccharide deacetylase